MKNLLRRWLGIDELQKYSEDTSVNLIKSVLVLLAAIKMPWDEYFNGLHTTNKDVQEFLFALAEDVTSREWREASTEEGKEVASLKRELLSKLRALNDKIHEPR